MPPEAIEAPTFEEALKEAFAKRPDLQEQAINVTNAGIDAKATAKALRPIATLTRNTPAPALAGNSIIAGATIDQQRARTSSERTVNPVTVLDCNRHSGRNL